MTHVVFVFLQVNYCTQACQKLHWFTHKKACKNLAEQFKKFTAAKKELEEKQAKEEKEREEKEKAGKQEGMYVIM